ncbi:MAG: flagellar basal body-associated FliL family protein [Desulfobacteraceae bacterium]|nr:flagellar basal body-associated FliL family protein [Desulfobacteraceae bacterium]
MKRFAICLILFLIGVSSLVPITGCGKEEKKQSEFAVGNWKQTINRNFILLIISPQGNWNSSVKIADATSKIVKSKGSAKGTWHIEKGQMIFTVLESDIEEIWGKNATTFLDIVELTENLMKLREESGYVAVWQRTISKKSTAALEEIASTVSMGPVVVNLNKNRSNDKDRYLCLDISLILKELMPGQEIPPIHPKAREAAIIFLSSLVFHNVKDFDSIKEQNKALVKVINPYMEGFIKEISIEHVIVATEIDMVEEFIIEHTMTAEELALKAEEELALKAEEEAKD